MGVRVRTVVLSRRGWDICIWLVYTPQGSVAFLQVTGSVLLQIILCCLIVVCLLSCCKNLSVTNLLPGLLRQHVHYVGNRRCTVTVYITS